MNATERYADVGTDGCANVMEDGEGGCLSTTQEPVKLDPNGDDFHWLDNPLGTELNDRWDPGEPYDDHGLDGVLDTNDVGESNGIFDTNGALVRAKASDVSDLITQLSDEALSLDLYDSGIRDPLHSRFDTVCRCRAERPQGRCTVLSGDRR